MRIFSTAVTLLFGCSILGCSSDDDSENHSSTSVVSRSIPNSAKPKAPSPFISSDIHSKYPELSGLILAAQMSNDQKKIWAAGLPDLTQAERNGLRRILASDNDTELEEIEKEYHQRLVTIQRLKELARSLNSKGPSTPPNGEKLLRYPSYVGRFELTTKLDLQYHHLVNRFTSGDDLAEWPLFKEAYDQLGDFVGKALDASAIAGTITTSMPVEGHKPLQKIDALVNECVKILGVPKPDVFIRNDPFPNAYAMLVHEPHALVLTSGLLDLYEGKPDELRFIIGHELGHMKCKHLKMLAVSTAMLMGLEQVDESAFKDSGLLPTLGLGFFCTWSREAELSADRAGLLCSQNPQAAYNALSRLLHGLRADSQWIDPDAPDFNADQIIRDFREWENRPFVEFIMALKTYSATHPYIPQRLAKLKHWYESGEPERILARTSDSVPRNTNLQVEKLLLKGIADRDDTVEPYVKVFLQDKFLFKTIVASSKKGAEKVAWDDIDESVSYETGQPLFFEVWDSNTFVDTLIGLFTVYPDSRTHVYNASIRWDVEERSTSARSGRGTVKLNFFTQN